MKYFILCGSDWYPGKWDDYRARANTIQECKELVFRDFVEETREHVFDRFDDISQRNGKLSEKVNVIIAVYDKNHDYYNWYQIVSLETMEVVEQGEVEYTE